MQSEKLTIQENQRDIPVKYAADVVVCGGGPAGVTAAVAAARLGKKTVLIEAHGFLGGVTTAAGVNGIGGWQHDVDGSPLIQGIPAEIIQRLSEVGGADTERVNLIVNPVQSRPTYKEGDIGCYWVDSNPEYLKIVYDSLVEESGVSLLLHTNAVMPLMDGTEVKGVFIESKSGREAILAKVVIDCTGDGDIAARAGAAFLMGREEDGFCQPMTQIFTLADGDVKYLKYDLSDREEDLSPLVRRRYRGAVKLAREKGEITYNPNDVVCSATAIDKNHPAVRSINFTRIQKVDSTDIESLTLAEVLGRKQIMEAIPFMRKYVAGCEKAALIGIPPHIGIRESRRILGKYYLTGDDIKNGKQFKDGIVRGIYCIDTHNPVEVGKSSTLLLLDQPYDIPYRCLVPKGIKNLLIAGRCITGDTIALSSYRIQSHCMAMGQAAGTAAAIAVTGGVSPDNVDPVDLRKLLLESGAHTGVNE